jgi:hypothetical protein
MAHFNFAHDLVRKVCNFSGSCDNPDLVLLGPDALGELAKAGKIDATTITPAFRSRVGVRAGAPKPDISTADAVRKTLLDAKSIGHSTGPSGEYFSKVPIERLGIADALKPRMKVVPAPVAAAVAKGEVDLGIHQIAELAIEARPHHDLARDASALRSASPPSSMSSSQCPARAALVAR